MEKTYIKLESGSTIDWEVYEEPMFDEDTGEELEEVYEYINIDNLYVAPEERGRGVARDLLNQAVKAIKEERANLEIKIVACPQEDCVDLSRLCELYDSISGIDEVVPV